MTIFNTALKATLVFAMGGFFSVPAFAHSSDSHRYQPRPWVDDNYHRPAQRPWREHRHFKEHLRNAYRDAPYSSRSHKACVPIKVVSRGGVGGFRTTDRIKDFKRIHSSAYHGKLCGKRTVEIELSKMDPRTKTVLYIGGQKYVFRPYEHADRYVNNWYRKYVTVNLNHFYPQHYKKHDSKSYSKHYSKKKLKKLHRDYHLKHWHDHHKPYTDSSRYRHGRYY
jgi:hypothetical protein